MTKKFLLAVMLLFSAILAFAQDYITLYADCNFRGTAAKLKPGRYSLNSTSVGAYTVSSIRIPSGYKVVLYDSDQPGNGSKTRYTGDVNCIYGEWNDKAGSVLVEYDNTNNNNNYNNNYNNNSYNNSYNNNSNQNGVVVYSDCNYNGSRQVLTPGEYDTRALTVGNDVISSIRVPSGWRIEVYTSGKYEGRKLTLTNSVNCFGSDWNEQISSVKVAGPSNYNQNSGGYNYNNNNNNYNSGGGDGITIYEDCYYGGASSFLRAGRYDTRQMGLSNDRISSMRIPNGYTVTVYEQGGFKGYSRTFTREINCFGADWNDKISSIEVFDNRGGGYQYDHPGNYGSDEHAVTFYDNSWFGGNRRTYSPGNYSIEGDQLDLRISSLTIERGYRVEVFDQPGFRGSRTSFSASNGNLSILGWNDRIRSFKIYRQ